MNAKVIVGFDGVASIRVVVHDAGAARVTSGGPHAPVPGTAPGVCG